MFSLLSTQLPKELVLLVIWEYIDPVPKRKIQQKQQYVLHDIKHHTIHKELLANTHLIE